MKCAHDHTVGRHRITRHCGVILLHTLLRQTVERICFCDPVPFPSVPGLKLCELEEWHEHFHRAAELVNSIILQKVGDTAENLKFSGRCILSSWRGGGGKHVGLRGKTRKETSSLQPELSHSQEKQVNDGRTSETAAAAAVGDLYLTQLNSIFISKHLSYRNKKSNKIRF